MKGKIRILSRTDGTSSVFEAAADLRFAEGGLYVTYSQDGDFVSLEIFPSCFKMTRRGSVGLQAEFPRKQEGKFVFLQGGGTASVPIQTGHYEMKSKEGSCSVRLVYDLIFQDRFQHCDLRLLMIPSEAE